MNFFFDYIYYRVTKAYFKWDGRTGGTAIVGVSMIQLLTILNVLLFIRRVVFGTGIGDIYPFEKWGILGTLALLVFYNYNKYNGSYNKFKRYWKDEPRATRVFKGILVVMSLVFPWVLLIFIDSF